MVATLLLMVTLTSREFNQDTGRAKKAAADGPVFITDRDRIAHVLLSIEEYQRLVGDRGKVVDELGLPPGIEEIDVEFPRAREVPRPADLV